MTDQTLLTLTYSECPKSERSVWETEQKMVRISDCSVFRYSGLWNLTILFRFQTLNPNKPVRNRFRIQQYDAKPVWRHIANTDPVIFRPFENLTICSVWALYMVPNQTSEIWTVWEWDNFGKRQNPNVRISDVYCILQVNPIGCRLLYSSRKKMRQ